MWKSFGFPLGQSSTNGVFHIYLDLQEGNRAKFPHGLLVHWWTGTSGDSWWFFGAIASAVCCQLNASSWSSFLSVNSQVLIFFKSVLFGHFWSVVKSRTFFWDVHFGDEDFGLAPPPVTWDLGWLSRQRGATRDTSNGWHGLMMWITSSNSSQALYLWNLMNRKQRITMNYTCKSSYFPTISKSLYYDSTTMCALLYRYCTSQYPHMCRQQLVHFRSGMVIPRSGMVPSPIGSMVLVYMLTWLGYIDGKWYHI